MTAPVDASETLSTPEVLPNCRDVMLDERNLVVPQRNAANMSNTRDP